ncbi:alpha/beta hydrolase [Streptomyces sp. ID05-04B]|uniref:alpha/beta fold hydrolase n=1 Tax=Streptomyces sp. ID05-04B TaxID=3028661 RepID=UPI0029C35433|nr:alpha/beta hydrolase [Streptomyces sp. ID05-04B]MDX5562711.1 alpha/beta hydrolase [Streptomyces sp. ID05-04B]
MSTLLGPLHVQDAGPADGPVALLWPSLFSDGETSWSTQLAGLHELGWRTLLVDPPGTGGSASASRRFTMEECGEAALQVLDDAAVDRAALLGLSWGGFVALRVALIAPHRVTALVLSNTSARGVGLFERLRVRMTSLLIRIGVPGGPGRLVAAQMFSRHSRRHDSASVHKFAETVDNLDTVGLVRAVRSVLGDRSDVVNVLHRITAPSLVIVGAEDKALPQNPHSDDLAHRIADARLVVLPRVAHLAPCEEPTKVAALIKEFLTPLG